MGAYEEALGRAKRDGASRCDDAAAMAGFLAADAEILLGAVSPRLLWAGAQHAGLTSLELAALIHGRPDVAADLMWVDTSRPLPRKAAGQLREAVAAATGRAA
jgi:hypothetical protein